MESLHRKVIKALKTKFPDVEDGLETIQSTGRVTGWVASEAFDGQDNRQRQTRLRKILKDSLTNAELEKLGPIVALSPVEMNIDVNVDR